MHICVCVCVCERERKRERERERERERRPGQLLMRTHLFGILGSVDFLKAAALAMSFVILGGLSLKNGST